MRVFKFVTILVLELKKIHEDETMYSTFYSNSKSDMLINGTDINDTFESVYGTIISKIQQSPEKGSNWVIDSMIDHNIDRLKCKPVNGGKYPKRLDFPRKYR